ncbi:MAG: hypothetical protein J1F38_03260 [Muribaculaceae bacterium]|nr:hypothetical protein [Muribaculaceae bacterium]
MDNPYFIVPLVEEYKTLPADSQRAREIAKIISVNIGDKETLCRILGDNYLSTEMSGDFSRNINEAGSQPSDSDLSQEAQSITGTQEEIKTSSELTETATSQEDSSFDTINAFLDKFAKNIPPMGYVPEDSTTPPEETKEEVLTESEVKTTEKPITDPAESIKAENILKNLIKLKRYQEALEFIKTQNLNNPKKSIYFAHQMRFIKKLMALENFKDRN